MTIRRGPTVEAVPNVLQNETVPNTLAGMLQPARGARRRLPNGMLIVVGAAIAAIVALIVARAA